MIHEDVIEGLRLTAAAHRVCLGVIEGLRHCRRLMEMPQCIKHLKILLPNDLLTFKNIF